MSFPVLMFFSVSAAAESAKRHDRSSDGKAALPLDAAPLHGHCPTSKSSLHQSTNIRRLKKPRIGLSQAVRSIFSYPKLLSRRLLLARKSGFQADLASLLHQAEEANPTRQSLHNATRTATSPQPSTDGHRWKYRPLCLNQRGRLRPVSASNSPYLLERLPTARTAKARPQRDSTINLGAQA
jgi:hypothetical protein